MYYCVKLVITDVPESRQIQAGIREVVIAGKNVFR